MSRTRRLSAALLLFVCLPFPVLAASDAADSAYWDYRIPAHHWHQSRASLTGIADHSDFTIADNYKSRQGRFQGQLNTSLSGGFDSDPLTQFWSLTATLFGRRTHDEQQTVGVGGDGEFSERTTSDVAERFFADYGLRAYPWAFPWGLTVDTHHRVELAQQSTSLEVEDISPSFRQTQLNSTETDRWIWNGELSVGTGLGRVRNVTPVYEAQVLEDRLLASGALARPLSRSARERLAALFTVQTVVWFAHERPDKYFWEELERVLVEDGALERGSLTLYEAHRILEPTTIRGRILRSAGWFVGPSMRLSTVQVSASTGTRNSMVVYQADTLFLATESGFDSDDYREQDFASTVLSAEYHHPAGPNWQFDLRQETSIQESGENLFTSAFATATWVVSDRWLATARFQHGVLWGGDGFERAPSSWVIQYGADLSYFLEDRWALTLTGVEEQFDDDFVGHSRQGSYSLGISYVFSGLFEAPGLTAAMRPIPGGR